MQAETVSSAPTAPWTHPAAEVAAHQQIVWQPQPGPQMALLQCPIFEVFYGGARGGGKTEGSLGDWLQHSSEYGEHAIGLFVRRKFKQLSEVVARAKQIFIPLGAKYNETKQEFLMPGGGRLKFAYLERDSDAEQYQGHSYCVGIHTPILMADGSYLPLKDVKVGHSVMTLQGPKAVLGTVPPYLAPCVRAQVLAEDGTVLHEQIQPVWHPLASSDGLNAQHNSETRRSAVPTPPAESDSHKPLAVSPPDTGPAIRGWRAYAEDGRTDYTAFAREPQDIQRLPVRSFLAVLHAPAHRSWLVRHDSSGATTGYQGSPAATSVVSLGKFQELPSGHPGSPQLLAHVQSVSDHANPYPASELSCADLGLRRVSGSPADCLCDHGSCGERVHAVSGTVQASPPSQACVEARHLQSREDAQGTTPTRIPSPQQSLVHPYTGKAMPLSEEILLRTVSLVPCGYSLVGDLQVADNNHYITECGLVNKNTRLYVEEVTNFPSAAPVNKLRACLRSAAGVAVGMRLTGNPGGPGHTWVKARYIDPAPQGFVVIAEETAIEVGGVRTVVKLERVFIPSKISDNQLLLRNDPTYILRLRQSGSEALVKAWLEGDWSMVDGAFFSEFSYERHVLAMDWLPLIPPSALRFRAFDWGSAKPFSCGWYAVSDGSWGLPHGALLKYREWYGADGPNKGLKMTAENVAIGIRDRERGELIRYGAADPSIFIRDGGPSIAESMSIRGCTWRRADNRRKPGWEILHQRLQGGADGRPLLYFLECCDDTIRTLPVLQHDETDPEDLDTDAEDHAADETRYAVTSRPWVNKKSAVAAPQFPKHPSQMTINELIEKRTQKRRAREKGD